MGSLTAEASTADIIKLPVIDISELNLDVGKQLIYAATKYGFLYIDTKGTGFTKENVDRTFDLSKRFFSSPVEEKAKCQIGTDNRGWTGMHNEILDPKNQRRGDFKEAMNVGEFAPGGKSVQVMPAAFDGHEGDLDEFQKLCRKTCLRILDLLALGLEVEDPKFFSSRHVLPSGTTLRMLHYPALPADAEYNPEVDIRAGAHSDYGSMTLLFQREGQPGLEIRTPEDTWAPVAVVPEGFSSDLPPILINIADLMSYWTNGLLKSTVHRVIFPLGAKQGEDRYSMAYFFHPANDTELIPVPSQIVQSMKLDEGAEVGYGGGAATKRAITAQQHLMNRLEATYGFRMETGK